MNLVVLSGRLTSDPKVNEAVSAARYSLAVDKTFHKDGEPSADFINCVAFGKSAEFAKNYLCKGKKILVTGHIITGSYEKDGQTIKTTDVVVDRHEFCESKTTETSNGMAQINADFMSIPDDIQEELPFL